MSLATTREEPLLALAHLPDPAANRLMVLAERLTRTISVARALVGAGRTVDLAGFEDGVGLLCAKTLDLPFTESRAVLPALLELKAQLDTLQTTLAERQANTVTRSHVFGAAQRGH